jgi:anti-anti-sigma factor
MAFEAILTISDDVAQITLSGDLDASTAPMFKEKIEEIPAADIQKLVLVVKDLQYMSSAGLRVLIFSKQKMGSHVQIYVVSPQEMVLDTLEKTGFHHSVTILDEYGLVTG